jgi:orotate phosphoribosyltransferase
MADRYQKIEVSGISVPLRVMKGHFATNHAHTNYYIDLTMPKGRASEAHAIAFDLANTKLLGLVIDTIVCMEGTEVIGAFLSEELTKNGYLNTNAHKTIYVTRPEFNSNSQIIFRDNLKPMITGKHVLILMGSVVTGRALNKAMESIQYYGGTLAGVAAIFSAEDEVNGVPVRAVFTRRDLPDYAFYDYHNCPLCKSGAKIDALVNAYGISSL